jgi:hypothetical protein
MTLRNLDGTPYRTAGSIQQFDPENPEHNLFNLWDQEIIKAGGSPIHYYEVFIQKATADPVYREDRGKLFAPVPIELWASYEPVEQQNFQSAFGIDSPDEVKFELNYRAVLQAIGHPPKVGSRIFTPHKRENWIIVQRKLGEYKMWGELRLMLICERWQESLSTPDGVKEQKQPDFTIN